MKRYLHLMAVLFVSCGFAFGQQVTQFSVTYEFPERGIVNGPQGASTSFEVVPGVDVDAFHDDPTFSIEIEGNSIRLFNFRNYSGFPNPARLSNSNFNGPVFTRLAPTGGLENVQLKATNITGLNGGRVSFTPQEIAINLSGLTYDSKSELVISFAADSDGDGLDDSVETNTGIYVDENNTGTDPNNPDTDGDFLKDGLEVIQGLSPVTHFDFSGDETSYTYIPATASDGTTIDVNSPLANLDSISSEDVWDINNGAIVTQASVSFDPPAERVLGYEKDSVILAANTAYLFNIPEPKLIKGLYIHTDGDRSTSNFRLYFRDDSGAWIEHTNVSFLDSGRIPYYSNGPNNSIIFAVDFPDFVGSEFQLQFGSSNSRLEGAAPRIIEVDAITETLPTFQTIEGNFTWQEAKADAEAKGGRLAVLDTQEKIDAANTYLEDLGEWPALWIGLNTEPNFQYRWINGDPLTANNWHSNAPSNEHASEGLYGYVYLYPNPQINGNLTAGTWDDTDGWEPYGYLLEILERPPAAPVVELDPFYESNPLEEIVVDATPTEGFPDNFTYQWSFNDFEVPAFLGGAEPTLSLLGTSDQNGTWNVVVSNSVGSTEASFEYRMFEDNDADGISNYREANITLTNPDNADSDSDGLLDPEELYIHETDPNIADVDEDGLNDSEEIDAATDPRVADSDSDGLSDGLEVKTYSSNPNKADTDGDGIADAAEVAAGLNINTTENIAAAVSFLTAELAKRPPVDGFEEAIAEARTSGRNDVTSAPSEYDLYEKEAYNAVVTERDARPTLAQYSALIVERDARFLDSDEDGITDDKETELETDSSAETVFYLQQALDTATTNARSAGQTDVTNNPAQYALTSKAAYDAVVVERDARFLDSDEDGITDEKETELETDSSTETVFYLQQALDTATANARSAGQSDVTNDPAQYALTSKAAYDAVVVERDARFLDSDEDGITDEKETELETDSSTETVFYLQQALDTATANARSAGQSDVTNDPAQYALTSKAAYDAVVVERDARFLDSDEDGITDEKETELETDSSTETVFYLQQALDTATANARSAGQSDVTNDPAQYALTSKAAYDAVVVERDARFLDSDEDGITDEKETELETDSSTETVFYLQQALDTATTNARSAGQTDVTNNPAQYALTTKAAYDAVVVERDARPTQQSYEAAISEARIAGQQDVVTNPTDYSLFSNEAFNTVVAERDARPTIAAYNTAIVEALSAGRADVTGNPQNFDLTTIKAYDAIVAERDARPTQDDYNEVVAERDARFTQSDIQDAKLGAVVLLPELVGGETKIAKLRFCIEESDDLGNWTTRKEEAEVNIPLLPGKKFYRFLIKENE